MPTHQTLEYAVQVKSWKSMVG